jgi:hypothetical protein
VPAATGCSGATYGSYACNGRADGDLWRPPTRHLRHSEPPFDQRLHRRRGTEPELADQQVGESAILAKRFGDIAVLHMHRNHLAMGALPKRIGSDGCETGL